MTGVGRETGIIETERIEDLQEDGTTMKSETEEEAEDTTEMMTEAT